MELHLPHDFEKHCIKSAFEEFETLQKSGKKFSLMGTEKEDTWFDQIDYVWKRICPCENCPPEGAEVPPEIVASFLSLRSVRRMGTYPMAPLLARLDEKRVEQQEKQKQQEIEALEKSYHWNQPNDHRQSED